MREKAVEQDGVLVTLDKDFARFQLKPGDVPRGVLWIKGSDERVAEANRRQAFGEVLQVCDNGVSRQPL